MNNNNGNTTGSGIGIGTILAIILSWGVNHSILWALIDGCLGWLYVIYYFCIRR